MLLQDIESWIIQAPAEKKIGSAEDIFTLGTDKGHVRPENQDRIAILRVGSAAKGNAFWCACLCDGMGGLRDGAAAASIAVSQFFLTLIHERRRHSEERLRIAVEDASLAVRKKVKGGGATISAILIERGQVISLNVGDSRIYAFSCDSDKGKIERLTVDDTMEEAYGGEGRGLLQFLGSKDRLMPHIEKRSDLLSKDLILTSDGAHRIGDALTSSLKAAASCDAQFVDRMLTAAQWIGGVDNASAIAFSVDSAIKSIDVIQTADISIWTPSGRLKVVWPRHISESQLNADRSAEKETDSESNAQLNSEAESDQTETRDGKLEVRKRGETRRKPKKGKKDSDVDAKDQIELGFSEGDEDA